VTPIKERISPAVIPKNQWIWKNVFLNMMIEDVLSKEIWLIITKHWEDNMDFVGNINFHYHL